MREGQGVGSGRVGRREFQKAHVPMAGEFTIARPLVKICPFETVWAQMRVTLRQRERSLSTGRRSTTI